MALTPGAHEISSSLDVVTTPVVSAGKPRRLFEKRYQRSQAFWPKYDVTADGKRLLMIKRAEQTAPTRINVVLNWFEELKQRLPSGRGESK
jgi:hypothetical protein